MLNDVAVREAFHVILLHRVSQRLPPSALALKGGVNLRLFFRSRRYSEDMDLDGDPASRESIRRGLRQIITDPSLVRRLAGLGIRGIEESGRASKDTETTLRHKVRMISQGGVPLPTKIEISFRQGVERAAREAADPAVSSTYLRPDELPLVVTHYPLMQALVQKIRALAGRAQVQARDVFDITELRAGRAVDVGFLRQQLSDDVLREANDRALRLPYEEYRGTVTEFLDPTDRALLESERAWDDQRLQVSELLNSVLSYGKPTPDASPGEVQLERSPSSDSSH